MSPSPPSPSTVPPPSTSSHHHVRDCRMYESPFPAVDEVVMAQVKSVADMGAYVSLLEYNGAEGMILLSELSRRRIRSISSLIKVGRTEPVMVVRVDRQKGYIDLSKRRVSEEEAAQCEERFNRSKVVHGIMRHVAETTGADLEDLYVHVGWPLYKKYGHAFEAFKIAVTDPSSVFDSLTRQEKRVDEEGKETLVTVPALSPDVLASLLSNIRRRMTPQPCKIRADVELKCFHYDGVLHIKDAMRKAEQCGSDDCVVRMKLVAPPLYVLTTQTLDKEIGVVTLQRAIEACQVSIESKKGRLTVKQAPRAVSEREDKMLQEHMARLTVANEEMDGDGNDSGGEGEGRTRGGAEGEDEDEGMGDVDVERTQFTDE